MKLFNKGDNEYFKWMSKHPEGFILNTGKGAGTSEFILHKSNCRHLIITGNRVLDSYTTKDWIKVGSTDVDEITTYCLNNKSSFFGQFKICSSCNPEYIYDQYFHPDELQHKSLKYTEGSQKQVQVNAYERNDQARSECIRIRGTRCLCCGMNFEEKYGNIGKGFIHIHHLEPLSKNKEGYEVDPAKGLIPVCPNCHSMLHKKDPPYSIPELKSIMATQKK